jgi:hypothetical protein
MSRNPAGFIVIPLFDFCVKLTLVNGKLARIEARFQE